MSDAFDKFGKLRQDYQNSSVYNLTAGSVNAFCRAEFRNNHPEVIILNSLRYFVDNKKDFPVLTNNISVIRGLFYSYYLYWFRLKIQLL